MIQIKMYDDSGREVFLQAGDIIDLRIRKEKHEGALPTLYISIIRDGKKIQVGRGKKDEIFIAAVANIDIGTAMVTDLLSQSVSAGHFSSSHVSKKHSTITVKKVNLTN